MALHCRLRERKQQYLKVCYKAMLTIAYYLHNHIILWISLCLEILSTVETKDILKKIS